MKRVNLPRYDVTRFDSRGVQMLGAAMLDDESGSRDGMRVLIIECDAAGFGGDSG